MLLSKSALCRLRSESAWGAERSKGVKEGSGKERTARTMSIERVKRRKLEREEIRD